MAGSPPPDGVLRHFGCAAAPELMDGGQRTTYRSGDVVLKPSDGPAEADWVAEIYDRLANSSKGFLAPAPVRGLDGGWWYEGWVAWNLFRGEHEAGRWAEKIDACRAFHRAVADVARPSFFSGKQDPWSVADRMAWEEERLVCAPETRRVAERLLRGSVHPELPGQVIHGDICGNFLFGVKGPPCVIDLSPYWRPAEFAEGVLIVDAVVWEDADLSLATSAEVPSGILARAALRRVLEHDLHFRMRGFGSLSDVLRYAALVDAIA